MAYYRTSVLGAEPYQESQGSDDPPSPVEFKALYEDMQRRDSAERRLTKRKSGSIWPRKSKRSATAPSTVTGPSLSPQPLPPLDHQPLPSDTSRYDQGAEMAKLGEQKEKHDSFFQTNQNHGASIIPDNDLPAWYNKDVWASVPPPMYKAAYRIHNPVGPKWYRNYHLIPPSQLRPTARPPSFFSPSFPHMGTNSLPEHSRDSSRLAGPSRTPSGSPLPTPSSSQTRVTDPTNKPRSRKPSLTTPDGIEIDITDPWGTTWHHPSPYDFGISPISSSSPAGNEFHAPNRARRASISGYQVKRKAAPSPLSQSTSAVHLQPPAPPSGPNVLRKPTPLMSVDNMSTTQTINAIGVHTGQFENSGLDVASSSISIMTKNSKKEKHSSVLGRLAKKFSLLRKSNDEGVAKADWHHVAVENVRHDQSIQPPVTAVEFSIGEVGYDPSPPLNRPAPYVSQEADRSSSISLEAQYPTGRLTVVNPDLPSSEDTPALSEAPLMPEQVGQAPGEPTPIPNNVGIEYEIPLSESLRPSSSTTLSNRPHDAQSPIFTDIINYLPLQSSRIDDETPESLPPTPPAKSRAPSPVLPAPITPTERILQGTAVDVSTPHDSSMVTERQPTVFRPASPMASPRTSRAHATVHSMSDVPFPTDDSILVPPQARFSYTPSSNYSPLSTSSMLVNPPTPHNSEVPMPSTPEPPPPVFLARDKQSTNRLTSLQNTGTATNKQTETFRLVRGASGRIHGSTDTIVASGQQWEVVETLANGKNKVRQSSRRDQEREKRDGSHNKYREGERSVEREQRRREQESAEANIKDYPKEMERSRDDLHDEKGGEGKRQVDHSEVVEREREKEQKEREREWEWERQRQRQKELEREKEKERHREREREKERQKEREREERERRREREKEKEKEKERERQKEREKEKERERQREREKEKERERQREREKEKERERQREREKEKERERQREREKEKERERQKERERERQREKEREREREREKEYQREKEREREREKEKERQREEREREIERERQKEEKEREKEKERQKEREERQKEKEREKERQREKEREKALKEREERERREREQRHERRKEKDHRKEKKERERERQMRHSEEQAGAHPEGSRHRMPGRSHRHEGSPSTLSLEQGPAETRSNHERARARPNYGDALTISVRPPLERNPSAPTRPTSEYLSAADLVALRAKDAYEMERLFKARSLYGQEPDGVGPNSIPSSNASEKGSSTDPALHGSGHTAYVIQTPFQSKHRLFDAPLPQVPNAQQDPSGSYSYLNELEILSIPSLDSPDKPHSNPLPEPPRQSTYQPTPLAILESNGAYSSDYWTKYAVTTAH